MTRNTKLLIIAVLSVTASVTGAILATTYIQQIAIAQNRTGSTGAGISLSNLTGSVQVFPGLSQTIQSKARISLSTPVTIAEKSVGPSSHAVSVHIGVKNGYLVYTTGAGFILRTLYTRMVR